LPSFIALTWISQPTIICPGRDQSLLPAGILDEGGHEAIAAGRWQSQSAAESTRTQTDFLLAHRIARCLTGLTLDRRSQ
jgi:hypothetical protein